MGDWVGINEMPDSQGAKWVYLTWDAVKGCLVTFCSVASTYQILTVHPENYAAVKKLQPFSHCSFLLILTTVRPPED